MTKRIRSFLRPAVGHRFLQTWTCIFWYTLWLYVSHSRYTLNLSHCGNVSTLSTLRNVSAANRENENQALKRVPTIKLSFTAGQKEKQLEEHRVFKANTYSYYYFSIYRKDNFSHSWSKKFSIYFAVIYKRFFTTEKSLVPCILVDQLIK